MTRMLRWTAIPAIALTFIMPAAVAGQPVKATVVLKSGERHTGQHLQYRYDWGELSLRKSLHDQLRVSPDQIAFVDFGGTPDVLVTLSGSQQAVVLRNGTTIKGQLIEMNHASTEDQSTPFLVIMRNEQGQERRFPAAEVGRVYFAGVAAVAKPTTRSEASAGGGFVVSARQRWTSTGIMVQRGDVVRFATTGEIQLSEDSKDIAGSAGARSQRPAAGAPLPRHFAGALIGRIGTDGRPFAIGDQTSVQMPESGQLFLGINDDDVTDNQGEFRVEIQRTETPSRRW